MNESLIPWFSKGAEGPARLLVVRVRRSGWERGGNNVLSEAELTVPGQASGGEVGDIEFDRGAGLDRVNEKGFDPT